MLSVFCAWVQVFSLLVACVCEYLVILNQQFGRCGMDHPVLIPLQDELDGPDCTLKINQWFKAALLIVVHELHNKCCHCSFVAWMLATSKFQCGPNCLCRRCSILTKNRVWTQSFSIQRQFNVVLTVYVENAQPDISLYEDCFLMTFLQRLNPF